MTPVTSLPHDTPVLYRFSGAPGTTVYGPRALEWVGECYGAPPPG